MSVEIDGLTLRVRDHGPGFAPDLLRDGPSRFRTASSERGGGHGLGLTIALAQAKVLDARLVLANAEDGGAGGDAGAAGPFRLRTRPARSPSGCA